MSKCGGDDSTDKLKQIPPRSVSAETREEQRALTAGRLLKEVLLPGTADEVGKKLDLNISIATGTPCYSAVSLQ